MLKINKLVSKNKQHIKFLKRFELEHLSTEGTDP